MPYYKIDNEQLLSGNWVAGPYDSFMLTEENKDEHQYPVDGWYWFENLDAAIAAFAAKSKPINTVTLRQAKLALLQAGLLSQVDSVIAALTGPEGDAARIEWQYANDVDRNSPLVQSLGTALNLTNEQLDELFATASTL